MAPDTSFRIYRFTNQPSGPAGEMHYTLEFVGHGFAFPFDIAAGRTPQQAAVLDRIRTRGPLPEGAYVALPDRWPGPLFVTAETQEVHSEGGVAPPAAWRAGEPRVPRASWDNRPPKPPVPPANREVA